LSGFWVLRSSFLYSRFCLWFYFLYSYWLSWFPCLSRDDIFSYMSYAFKLFTLYNVTSLWIWSCLLVLTFCWCCMAFFICLYILMRLLN